MARPSEVRVVIHVTKRSVIEEMSNRLDAEIEPLQSDAEELVEKKRMLERRAQGTPAPREGRGDTGTQLWGKNGLQNTVVATKFLNDLTSKGYRLVEVRIKTMPVRDRETGERTGEIKWAVHIAFSCENDVATIDDETDMMEAVISVLCLNVWRFCHSWENDYGDTHNLTGGVDNACRRIKRLRFMPSPNDMIPQTIKVGNYAAIPHQFPKESQPSA